MNIILVSGNLTKVRTIALTRSRMIALAAVLGVAGFFASGWLYSKVFDTAPGLSGLAKSALGKFKQQPDAETDARYLRDHLNALSIKLGEMQAKLMRLDAVGERIAKSVGLNTGEFRFNETPARGGLAPQHLQVLTLKDVDLQIDHLARSLEDRSDKLDFIDSILIDERIRLRKVPTFAPVTNGWRSSNFGYRSDPFTGERAFHEGIDFISPLGTAVSAAAAGVVSMAEQQSDYGNIVEIDHGNGLATRYAHLSKRDVNVGDVVLKGQKIAEVGSTGRSTGPHLHFEVLDNRQPVDPTKFLDRGH